MKTNEKSTETLMKEMLDAGVHFGHQRHRWHPKMKPFIFTEQKGVHIFDLEKTAGKLTEALQFVRSLAARGETILFVGTKKQAAAIIREEAERAGMPYIIERWPGGLLTNFSAMSARPKRLRDLLEKQESGANDALSKKDKRRAEDEIARLKKLFSGIVELRELPHALFVVDVVREQLAVREANTVGVPVVAVCDSNANPDNVQYPIPGNDDAVKAIRLVTAAVADAVLKGREAFKQEPEAQPSEQTSERAT